MTTSEELYEKLPDSFKEVFKVKQKKDVKKKEEWRTPLDVMQEVIEKIKQINKR